MTDVGAAMGKAAARSAATPARARRSVLGKYTGQALLIVTLSTGLFGLVWLYGSALRDPRYLDGWILAGGMILQLGFHIAVKSGGLSPKSAVRWRKIHVLLGYLLIAAFASHCDLSLPDTALEWMLWTGFVLVTISGVLGTYLAWSLKVRGIVDERTTFERIPEQRAELARTLQTLLTRADPASAALGLPVPPHDAWIMDLYTTHLSDFFAGQRNVSAHLVRSQGPLKQLIDEIEDLARYVDPQSKDKLATIRELVVEKDRLDFASVQQSLTRGLFFLHVPVTYALIVVSILHVVVAYAFSSGVW
jgi:hypothetical protein